MSTDDKIPAPQTDGTPVPQPPVQPVATPLPKEIGGKDGPEPTRYGDWQHKGRVSDF